jgi:single-strand DNA-binding protein
MAGSLNKVMIIGNVGRDPEMRYTSGGQPVTQFSVAAGRSWTTPEGDRREETEWFRVVAWRKLAEIVNQYVKKGSKVYVEGRLQTRSWDGQDGQKHYTTEVIATEVTMLDSRPRTEGGVATPTGTNNPFDDSEGPVDPDAIPF